LESWEPSQYSPVDTGKPIKTSTEVAGRMTFRILTASQQFGSWLTRVLKLVLRISVY